MRPPICAICDQYFNPDEGMLLQFAPDEATQQWNIRVEKEKIIGHPPNLEWFCAKHSPIAQDFTDLPIGEALAKVRAE